jgi:hypothetical protein
MYKSWRMRLAGHVARMGEKMNAYRILVGKPEGKSPCFISFSSLFASVYSIIDFWVVEQAYK